MSALEEVTEFVQGGQQGVDIVPIVVAGQRGAHRAADTKRFHQRHGAVMADPQGYALHVEQGGGILRVDVVQQKGDRAGALTGFADQTQPWHLLQSGNQIVGQHRFMAGQ